MFAQCCTESQPGLEAELLQEVGNSARLKTMLMFNPISWGFINPIEQPMVKYWDKKEIGPQWKLFIGVD